MLSENKIISRRRDHRKASEKIPSLAETQKINKICKSIV